MRSEPQDQLKRCWNILNEKSYKKAIKIFENLSYLYDEPYYIDSIIEIEKLYEKYTDIKFNTKKMEILYRKASLKYLIEAKERLSRKHLED